MRKVLRCDHKMNECFSANEAAFCERITQVDMKNVDKSSKHFFGYFNTLETHSGNSFHEIHSSSLNDSSRFSKNIEKSEKR